MRLEVLFFAVVALSQARSHPYFFDDKISDLKNANYIGENALGQQVEYGGENIIIERVPMPNAEEIEKREVKGFSDLTEEEKSQWKKVIVELKQSLREKFGMQDPEEDYRVDPEVRERYKLVKKELLKVMEEKNGPVNGHDDQTDDEWKAKWGNVVKELEKKFGKVIKETPEETGIKAFFKKQYKKLTGFFKSIFNRSKRHQKRELKGFGEMTGEERAQWDALVAELKEVFQKKFGRQRRGLKSYEEMTKEELQQYEALLTELRQKLAEKFGKQDENEGLRPSMETRQKLKEVLKSISS